MIFFPFGAAATAANASAAFLLASHEGCIPFSTVLAFLGATGWAFALFSAPRCFEGSKGSGAASMGAGLERGLGAPLFALPPFATAGTAPVVLAMWFAPLPYFASHILRATS